MATVKEITTKCKAGEVDEAYELALQDWNNAPGDVWTHREVGWALYYLVKQDVDNQNIDSFFEHYDKLLELNLLDPTNDKMIFESVLWKLAEYTKSIPADSFETVSNIFSKIQNYQFVPSEPYSRLLQYFLKFDGWDQLADFIEWWNLDNLQPADYDQVQLANGKKMMSLTERAYIAYSKALLKRGEKERIASFIPQLESLMEKHPAMLYPGYFCGKLLIAQGAGKDEALEKVVPFVKKKLNEFWAWQLMSDVFRDDPQKQLACLLRAVHCKTQETFLGKIRIRLAEIYLQNNDRSRAKYHIDKVSACYLEQGWRMPGQIQHWSWQSWLQATQPDSSDPIDYKPITDAMLFSGLEECLAVVTYVDPQAKKAAIVYGLKKRLMTKYGHWGLKPREGIVVRLHYSPEADGINIARVELAHGQFNLPYLKEVTGNVDKRGNNPFAFLKSGGEQFFISPAVVSKYHLNGNESATAIVAYDFNKKRNEWGWSCISIKQ